MAIIFLTQNKQTIVDDVDFARLTRWKWFAHNRRGYWYAARSQRENGKIYTITMSRELLGLKKRDSRQVDHKDGDTLNNRRANLRVATLSQNMYNRRSNRNSSSRYKGVSYHKKTGKWQAQIRIEGNNKYLGVFGSPEEAARSYNEAAKENFGDFACLNRV
jgi:hypothetical protein